MRRRATSGPLATPAAHPTAEAVPKPRAGSASGCICPASIGLRRLGEHICDRSQRSRGSRRRAHLDDGPPPADPSGRRGMGRHTRAVHGACRGWRRSPSGSVSACWCRRRFAIDPRCSPSRSPRSTCCRAAGRCAGSASDGSRRSTSCRHRLSRRSVDATPTSRMRCRCSQCCGERVAPLQGNHDHDRRRHCAIRGRSSHIPDDRRWFRRAPHTCDWWHATRTAATCSASPMSWPGRSPCSARHCNDIGRDVTRDRRLASVDGVDRPRPRRGGHVDRTTATEADGCRAICPRRRTPARLPITTSGRGVSSSRGRRP